jgi:hypothetical protein
VPYTPVDHKDTVFTEAFSNVMNERALTNSLSLNFKDITYNSNDWKTLQAAFNTARTTLKCVWIPDPKFPLRFLTFAKMKEMPKQQHNYIGGNADYVSFTLNLDESL